MLSEQDARKELRKLRKLNDESRGWEMGGRRWETGGGLCTRYSRKLTNWAIPSSAEASEYLVSGIRTGGRLSS